MIFCTQISQAQNKKTPDPCHWSYSVEQAKPGEAMLILTAKLDSGWHLYSQYIDEGGPIPTKFNFDSSPEYKLEGKTEEGTPHKEYDPNFDMQLMYFEKESIFKQKIKVEGKKDFTISGTIDYMVCLEQCIFPPPVKFTFTVKGN
jgi:thiol:disulfide interchange protein DsbD